MFCVLLCFSLVFLCELLFEALKVNGLGTNGGIFEIDIFRIAFRRLVKQKVDNMQSNNQSGN